MLIMLPRSEMDETPNIEEFIAKGTCNPFLSLVVQDTVRIRSP